MGERRDLQKTAEVVQPANQPFGLHLLLQVQVDVAPKRSVGSVRHQDERHHARLQVPIEVEPFAQLGGHERVHRAQHRPAGQQIDPRAPQLPSAGAGQHEPDRRVALHLLMAQRQELGPALDLVDDDGLPAGVGADELLQPFRPGGVGAFDFGIEQVDPAGVRVRDSHPCRLARATRPEQEVASTGILEESRHRCHSGPQYVSFAATMQLHIDLSQLVSSTEVPERTCRRAPLQGPVRPAAPPRLSGSSVILRFSDTSASSSSRAVRSSGDRSPFSTRRRMENGVRVKRPVRDRLLPHRGRGRW